MRHEIFEYRQQARGPRNYVALGLVMALIYVGWAQGWGLIAILLSGPILALILVRLVVNDAAGFRLTGTALDFYDGTAFQSLDWNEVEGVTVTGDGGGGSVCVIRTAEGQTHLLPATAPFSPERLTQEFRERGIPVWRPQGDRRAPLQSHLLL